jgi:hypothetical protein
VATELRKDPRLNVELIDGNHGEFTVSVDGKVVAQKGDNLPSVDEVLANVRKATHAAAV